MAWRMFSYLPVLGMILLSALAGWAVLGWFGAVLVSAAAAVFLVLGIEGLFAAAQHEIRDHPNRKILSEGFRERLSVLSGKAGLSVDPHLGFTDGAPNAFILLPTATRKLTLVVSEALHDLLSERQLLAVSAHELAHVTAGDHKRLEIGDVFGRATLMMAVAALVSGALAFIVWGHRLAPDWAWWALAVGPTVMSALNLAVTRRAEFRADAEAARLTGDPLALSQALARIQFATGGAQDIRSTVGEFAGLRGRGWWRTHPPVEARIDRLQRFAGRSARGESATG